MTQLYALIPFLTGVCVFSLEALVKQRRLRKDLLLASVSVVAVTVLALWLWRVSIPHQDTPELWSLLRFSLNMSSYYAGVWGFVLFPFVPLLVAACSFRMATKPLVAYLWTTVLTFLLLSFVYQWPESRFTAIYVQVTMLATLAVVAHHQRLSGEINISSGPVGRLSLATALFVAAQGLIIAPTNDWAPSWKSANVAPRETWFAEMLFTARPLDRFGLKETCASTIRYCENVRVPNGLDPYGTRIMQDYLAYQRKAQGNRQPRP